MSFPSQVDPFAWWGRVTPEKVAVVDRGRGVRWSYAAMDAAIDEWAGALSRLGVARGTRVGILAQNRIEHIFILFACSRLGALCIPLNWRLAATELQEVLRRARAEIVLGEASYRAAAGSAATRWVDLDRDTAPLLADAVPLTSPVAVTDSDPFMVLFTSGSTGTPKGAVLTHGQALWNAVATTTGWQLGADEIAPVSTPFFHTGGLNVFAVPLWWRGATIVLLERFDPEHFLAMLEEERCTIAFGVPTQFTMLFDQPGWGTALPHLRTFVSGGAACPPTVAERVRAAGYAFREGYGLTECGPNCFAFRSEASVGRPGVVGHPVPFLEMRLVDESLADVPPGEPGELLLRGPQLFGGYLDAPEATRAVFTDDGWLRTGDLAAQEPDGAFRICGRRKEMFISGGENVFPGEVEAVLAALPQIAEVVVVGVPDDRWGEVGRAFVMPRGECTPDAVIAFARSRLAAYKVPQSVVILAELPRLGSGKPDRRVLAAWTEVTT